MRTAIGVLTALLIASMAFGVFKIEEDRRQESEMTLLQVRAVGAEVTSDFWEGAAKLLDQCLAQRDELQRSLRIARLASSLKPQCP